MSAEDTPDITADPNVEPSADPDPVRKDPDIIIITGMSGAGRTEAVHTFEDIGYFCIDNLPPTLLMNVISLAGAQTDSMRKLAIVCDLRTKEFFPKLVDELRHLDEIGISYTMLFLDASDNALLRRFSSTRRRHPMYEDGMTVIEGIRRERAMLSEIHEMASYVIDTTGFSTQRLRRTLRTLYSGADLSERGLRVNVYSFGYKHGMPTDADIVMDVRHLPNPFYEPDLRPKTGLEEEVRTYVMEKKDTQDFLTAWKMLLDTVTPGYVKEGKQHLTIAIGCTGGQHRSVALAVETGNHLKSLGYHVTVTHRDIALAGAEL